MASPARQQTAPLTQRLLVDARNFPFVQAMRLLRLQVRNEAGKPLSERELARRIRVRPELSLAFAGRDVASIRLSTTDPVHFQLTVTFLGLYGTSSPLPTFYTEDLLQEWRDGQELTRQFLDLINNALYQLFFLIWAKYQLPYNVYEAKNQDFLDRLYSLAGMAEPIWRKQVANPFQALRYIGLLTQFPRSAAGLQSLVRDFLGTDLVHIQQCVTRQVQIPADQRFRLGVNACCLSQDATIGEQVEERQGRFQIVLGPLSARVLHELLPDRRAFSRLAQMIRFYLDQPLVWDLVLQIRRCDISATQLGAPNWSQLGWNSWMLSGKSQRRDVVSIVLPG